LVEESDRVWENIDNLNKTQSDHCVRITKLEQDHKYRDQRKNMNLTYILAGIVVMQLVFMVVELIW